MTLRTGLRVEQSYTVSREDLALHWGGDFPVLASPVLIGLLEKTCMLVTDANLPEGKTTVGVGFDLLHLAPTPENEDVIVIATLEEINRNTLKFSVEARDRKTLIASGMHCRGVVDRRRFLEKILER